MPSGRSRVGTRRSSAESLENCFLPVVVETQFRPPASTSTRGVSVSTPSGIRVDGLAPEAALTLVTFLEWWLRQKAKR